MVEAPPKPKIPADRIPSDSCEIRTGRAIDADGEVTVEGTPHYIHKGEWVEIIPVRSVMEKLLINQLRDSLALALDAIPGELDRIMGELCDKLAKRVMAWNWTDIFGDALPDPYRNSHVLMDLSNEEIFWLINCLNIETEETRKNGSGGSEDSS